MRKYSTTAIVALVCLVAVLVGSCSAFQWNNRSHLNSTQIVQLFQKFKQDHSKRYFSLTQETEKFNIFKANLETIRQLNNEDDGAEYGITQFSDMTASEFKDTILMNPSSPRVFESSRYLGFKKVSEDAADNFDWRDHGAVTSVKDQGSVGSCWAFSTVGNIEGQWALAGHNLTSLSVEQIVDCDGSQDPPRGNADCGVFGGWPYLALGFVIRTGGLPSDEAYPYCVGTGKCYPCPAPGYNETLCGPPVEYCNATSSPCRLGTLPVTATIEDWYALSSDEDTLKQQLPEVGPLSIALNASSLQFYRKGIFAPKYCNPKQLNHAVLLVGYGVDDQNVEFWTVKNSWGVKWGEQGYFRIKRGVGMCGVNTQAVTGVVNAAQTEELYMTYQDHELATPEHANLYQQQ